MTRTHSNSNPWAGSPGDLAGRTKGLTPLGKDIGKEMNRLGMMVDISHVSGKTFWDALEVSSTPLIASHSISNIPRNKTGEMIVALAKNGGVAQVNFGCGFDSQKSANRSSFGNPALGEKRARSSAKGISRNNLSPWGLPSRPSGSGAATLTVLLPNPICLQG